EIVELLDERARALRLLEAIETASQVREQATAIGWELGVDDDPLAPDVALTPGDRIWIRLHNRKAGAERWFVSVVLIDVVGQPWLLNASQPDGVELEPNDVEYVGRRPGGARAGFTLGWPRRADRSRAGQLRLLLLVCGR